MVGSPFWQLAGLLALSWPRLAAAANDSYACGAYTVFETATQYM